MDDQTTVWMCIYIASCGPFVLDGGPFSSYTFLLCKTVSYRELAESKLHVNDKWNNQIRAELLKASYLPLNSQAC